MKSFRKQKGFTLIELMIVVVIIGILATIAIPSFLWFQAKAKQCEAKTNLKAAFKAKKSYFATKDTYAAFSVVGYAPESGNRYTYCDGTDSISNEVPTPGAYACAGGEVLTSTTFLITANSNVDTDAKMDTWVINGANQLRNISNDVGTDEVNPGAD